MRIWGRSPKTPGLPGASLGTVPKTVLPPVTFGRPRATSRGMPRLARRWEPGALHHVVVRAHCGGPIFALDSDRAFVVERARRAFEETGATCLAWAVLVNHFHVLIRCEGPPGPTFARLNSALAWRVLRHRGEHGAVFQNRFWSDPCDDEGSVLTRLAYVLGNPVHHRVLPTVDALSDHPWSGLGEVLGLRKARWADPASALDLVDPDPARARRLLVQHLEEKSIEWAQDGGDPGEDRGLPSGTAPPGPEGVASEQTPATALTALAPDSAAVILPSPPDEPIECLRNALRGERWSPALVLPLACELTGASPDLVRAGAQTASEAAARAVVAFVSCDLAHATMVETAPLLGVGPTAMQYARRRGREHLARLGVDPRDVLARSRAGLTPGSCV